jgi:3-ketosteroid 9alpha-monooxygenase subunit B
MTETDDSNVPLVAPSRGFWLPVDEVVHETEDAHSFVLAIPPEHADRFGYRPGQFLTVRVPVSDDRQIARCYSLSSSPLEPGGTRLLTFTVKRTIGGEASNWLCDNITAGSTLEVMPPAGMFTPRALDGDFLLLAAGSGITPVMSILRSMLSAGDGHATLVYANRDPDSTIFADELRRLAATHPSRLTVVHWLEVLSGLPTATALGTLLAPYADREIFLCGPGPFMAEADTALRALGVPRSRLHVERFQSLPEDPFLEPDSAILDEVAEPATEADGGEPGTDAATLEVVLDGETHSFSWPATARMLDVLVDNGLSAPFSCRQGLCGACTCRIEEGEVSMANNEVLDAEDLADGYILACQSSARTPSVRINYT